MGAGASQWLGEEKERRYRKRGGGEGKRPPETERSGQGPRAAMRSPSLFSVMGTLWKGGSPEVKA